MKTSSNALISSSKDESVDLGARELTIATSQRMSRFLKSFFDERVGNHTVIQNIFLLLQLVPEQWKTILFYGEVPTGACFVQCMLVLMSEVLLTPSYQEIRAKNAKRGCFVCFCFVLVISFMYILQSVISFMYLPPVTT